MLSRISITNYLLIESLQRARGRGGEAAPSERPAPTRPSVTTTSGTALRPHGTLEIDPVLTTKWLVEFLRDEVQRRRGFAGTLANDIRYQSAPCAL